MKKFLVFLCAILLVFGFVGSSAAFYMDFEEGFGNNGTQIVGVPGVTFTSSGGETWTYGDSNTGGYNTHSVDLNLEWGSGWYYHYGYVFSWLGTSGSWGRIDFDDKNGTWFETGYCSNSEFTIEAYDADGNLLDSDSGPANLRYYSGDTGDMGWLRVEAADIAYVILSDSGNFWCADNMSGDMEGGFGVPEPATMLLLGSGLIGLGVLGRKKLFKKV